MAENGHDENLLIEEWLEHKADFMEAVATVNKTYDAISSLKDIGKIMIMKLDNIDRSTSITSEQIGNVDKTLVAAIVGKDQLPVKSANLIFRLLGTVIFVLLFVIGALLTGQKFGWIRIIPG